MSMPRWLHFVLDHYGVPYEQREHPPVYSASHLAHAEHISGYRVAKTVTLMDDGDPITITLPACRRVDVNRVREVLGKPNVRLATEEEVRGWFKGCHPGAAPPIRLRSDQKLFMDQSLACLGKILFAAGTPEAAIEVRFRDWYAAMRPGVGCFACAERHEREGNTPTVLVVEDEVGTNRLLCQLLERAGIACHGVEQGNQALAFVSEVRPSAILLDLMLPDMSGFEVCERLRSYGPLKTTPFIVVTALDDESSRQRGRQLGADAYLTKPFRPDRLVAEVRTMLADAHNC